ncbi:MAG: MATE family efflux transporter [Clostridia bacterium]|nr:MATE family efflux transporter [Clostridia bacterium]
MRKNSSDMLSGSIMGGLVAMSIPILIMNVTQVIFSALDMVILGWFADDTAVGAVGACSSLIILFTSIFIGVATGANVVVAKHLGEKDRVRTEQAVGTGITFSLISGVALLVFGCVMARTLLKWTNCPEVMLDQATTYFQIYFLGAPAIMLYNFAAAALRACGDTKRPMCFLMVGGVIKIILNLILIAGFNMDVAGVAIATIVTNVFAGVFCLWALFKKEDKFILDKNSFKIKMEELKQILFIGVPTGIQSGLCSFANVIIATAVNGFGPDATTGVSIANQFDGILYHVGYAPALAVIPYVAQNIGAGNAGRARTSVLKAIILTVIMGASCGGLSALFATQLSSTMSSTPAVIGFSRQKMVIISSTYFICGINEVLGGALKALNRPILPTVATLVYICLLRFAWVYLLFPLVPNLTFLYLVWPIGWILSILTLIIPLFNTLKRKGEVI